MFYEIFDKYQSISYIMKILLYCFLSALCLPSLGQQAIREVVASEGNTINVDQLSVSYTVGQPVAGTKSNSFFSITEGFQLGFREIVTSLNPSVVKAEIRVFPNPTASDLHLNIKLIESNSISVELYNISGQLVSTQTQSIPQQDHEMTLDLRNLSKGMYMLLILDHQGLLLDTYQIQKHL